jgi:hypothetical protein
MHNLSIWLALFFMIVPSQHGLRKKHGKVFCFENLDHWFSDSVVICSLICII